MGLKGKPLSEEHKRRISEGHKGIPCSEETKRKISKTEKGKRLTEEMKRNIGIGLRIAYAEGRRRLPSHLFKKGYIPWNKGKKGIIKAWNKGLTRQSDERVNRMAALREEYTASEETREKQRLAMLNMPDFSGNKGSGPHKKYVAQTANILKEQYKKVEVEKVVKIHPRHIRIIDILVNDTICYEIGNCKRDKIEELEAHGFKVINLPYASFGGD